jgi:hypothetical protein
VKTVKCDFCGAEHTQVNWAYRPFSCGATACENELRDSERERQAAEDAREDNYERYRY